MYPGKLLELVAHPLDDRSKLILACVACDKAPKLDVRAQFPFEEIALVEKDDEGGAGQQWAGDDEAPDAHGVV